MSYVVGLKKIKGSSSEESFLEITSTLKRDPYEPTHLWRNFNHPLNVSIQEE